MTRFRRGPSGLARAIGTLGKAHRATPLADTDKVVAGLAVFLVLASVAAGRIGNVPAGRVESNVSRLAGSVLPPKNHPLDAASAPRPIMLRGRVLGPTGAPVRRAKVYLVHLAQTPAIAAEPNALTDGEGRFEFPTCLSTLTHGAVPPVLHDPQQQIRLLATAPGFGVGFIPPPWPLDAITIPLTADAGPIRGRVVAAEGKPVAGARIKGLGWLIPRLGDRDGPSVAGWLGRVRAAETEWVQIKERNGGRDPQMPFGMLPQRFRWDRTNSLTTGLDPVLTGPEAVGVIPPPVLTDGDGRYQVAGVGQDRVLIAAVEGPGIATQVVLLTAERLDPLMPIDPTHVSGDGRFSNGTPAVLGAAFKADAARTGRLGPIGNGFEATVAILGAEATFVAQPGRAVVGVVRDLASGRPLPGVEVRLDQSGSWFIPEPLVRTTSGADGRFRLEGLRDDSVILLSARPAPGVPWLTLLRG